MPRSDVRKPTAVVRIGEPRQNVVIPTVVLTARICQHRVTGRLTNCPVMQLAPWQHEALDTLRARVRHGQALVRHRPAHTRESVARGAFRAEVNQK